MRILNLILIFAILVSLLGFLADAKNTLTYVGVDFRNIVVGARVLSRGMDPYFFIWYPGYPESLLSPVDKIYISPVSRVSVTPAVLVLISTIAGLPYKILRSIWLVLEWTWLLLAILFLSRSAKSAMKSKLIWIIGLFFISGSYFWRFHVDRGQIHILYTFLLALSYWILQRNYRDSHFLGGFLIGLTAALRPPAVLMMVPVVIYRKGRMFLGILTGLLCGILPSVYVAGARIWGEYLSAMRIFHFWFSKEMRLIPSPVIFPTTDIEGMHYNLLEGLPIPGTDSSLTAIFSKFGIHLYLNHLFLILAATVVLLGLLIYRYRLKAISNNLLFLIGMVMVWGGEFCVSARASYCDVIWLIPLSLIIIEYESIVDFLSRPLIILLFMGLFFSIGFTWLRGGILLSDIAMLAYVALTTFFLIKTSWQKERQPLNRQE